MDYKKYLSEYILTIIFGYILNVKLINEVKTVFLSADEFKIIIWLFIFSFIFSYLKNDLKISFDKRKEESIKLEYIVVSYAKIKSKYSEYVKCKYKDLNLLIYAMIIYNKKMKPDIIRKLDNYKVKYMEEKKRLGIMQVVANKPVSDEESIKLGIKKIEKICAKYINNKKLKSEEMFMMILNDYYKDNNISKQILDIYIKLEDFDKR